MKNINFKDLINSYTFKELCVCVWTSCVCVCVCVCVYVNQLCACALKKQRQWSNYADADISSVVSS